MPLGKNEWDRTEKPLITKCSLSRTTVIEAQYLNLYVMKIKRLI